MLFRGVGTVDFLDRFQKVESEGMLSALKQRLSTASQAVNISGVPFFAADARYRGNHRVLG